MENFEKSDPNDLILFSKGPKSKFVVNFQVSRIFLSEIQNILVRNWNDMIGFHWLMVPFCQV